jgi:deoxyribodipyrimidine photolyase-related protein
VQVWQIIKRGAGRAMSGFDRVILVAFDHLNFDRGAMAGANPQTDLVVLIESQRMLTGRNWHPERLFFMVASARHFAQDARERGFTVDYRQAATPADGLRVVWAQHGSLPTIAAQPSSFEQTRQFEELGITTVDTDFFLTPRAVFTSWAEKQKSFVMENFYRQQRVRLGILVDGDKPVAGRWNFDEDNRLPPPKSYDWPPRLTHARDAIDLEVAKQLGHQATEIWATTRAGALQALQHFIEHNLAGFGPLEDASTNDDWSLHHSLLSPYMNVGLLHASEVVAAAVAAFDRGQAPIQSVEAFVRQIIGWREYINGMYWFLGEGYENGNGLSANRKLLPLFTDSAKTKMNCVSSVVGDVEKRAWVHHIPRLMILSNLALVTSTSPQEFLDWMRENFIDASQWVMVPNVIGMGVHADGGRLMTKPYAAGGAYISRMTQYCKGCVYDPKMRVGDTACPFTTLYWDFLDRHRETFAKNHRMGQQLMGLNRLSDLPELRVRAASVLAGLENGSI